MPNKLNEITKEHILKAIDRIDREGIPASAKSVYYDLLYLGKRYPPKLVVSYAHEFAFGNILPRNTFTGGQNSLAFNVLRKNQFEIVNKEAQEGTSNGVSIDQGVKNITSFSSENFKSDLKSAHLYYSSTLIDRFIGALLTKPFVLLTGLSGSGKTRLAQSFAEWICKDTSQFRVVPVGADWTNREPLLGYPNALEPGKYVHPDYGTLQLILDASKPENKKKPYFLILDEMNLSHVERYFADFLSAMESGSPINLISDATDQDTIPRAVKLPTNLFIIGTVNIDETTYMFSPKVLDRANVIEFRITETAINHYLKNTTIRKPTPIDRKGVSSANEFLEVAANQSISLRSKDYFSDMLAKFFTELKKVGAEFGYRSAFEALRFAAIMQTTAPSWAHTTIMDAIILQKLLPKLHGSRRKLEPVLKTLGKLCLNNPEEFESFEKPSQQPDINGSIYLYPESYEKIRRMYNNLIDNGFTSFAEA